MKVAKFIKATVGIIILATLVSGAYLLTHKSSLDKLATMTNQEIRKKFDCDRITQDVRETDIFCNPDFYRNPKLSEAQYYAYLGCEDRLKQPEPTDTQKQSNPGPSHSYAVCKDKELFKSELEKFRQELVDLKQKVGK